MVTLRLETIQYLVKLLTEHDNIEKELIRLERLRRAGTTAPWELGRLRGLWEVHDALEREILGAMAVATDEEIHEAVEVYDATDAGKTANVLSAGQTRFAGALERLAHG